MPENISVEKGPEKAPSESGTPPQGCDSPTLTVSQSINLCATGLLICFFLPWAQFLDQKLSGFDLQKLGGYQKLLWLIPISCGITIAAGCMKQGQKSAAQFAGALPFLALAYWLNQLGLDVLKNFLAFGAYASLGLGLALIILSVKLKK
jgi:amino acid transporter